ncbi:MbtH family protein [Bacillus wiedmannii]|uniref:MbtH family protein n=1 Tax=Bacillus wiedmannii TaxID=1890302 RepID=UPI000BF18C31|nr:MbtH family NRPS accessory protein [Bacillus wiedmannii]PEL51564.1 MbtH family protein [Bacillus wiedmannii]PEO05783.1 MbtH family protein [Bacillus wiedmannii]PEP99141.1 MbtH family protein [Bacillus wiedmannii]
MTDNEVYTVVINEEEQYSIWPSRKEIPLGWKASSKSGTKQDCLEHINEVWVDMRPLSLRKKMDRES